VSEWRDFRPEYYNLGVLRSRLPDGIPFLGASATLDPKTLAVVKDRCGFDDETTIAIKTALDRPEIYLQCSSLRHPMNGMLDLQCVLPEQAASAFDIPKTIIFMESIRLIKKACKLIKGWMKQLGYPPIAATWVAPFFSDMATKDKERTGERFGVPSDQCTGPRILVASDSYGLGIDNPDIERVFQWLVPKSMARMYQRLGRGLPCGKGQAFFVLLHPPWCKGPRSGIAVGEEGRSNISIPEPSVEGVGRSANHKDADRRRDMPEGIWDFINVPLSGCQRDIGLAFFDDKAYMESDYVKPFPCCCTCDPEFQVSTSAHERINRTAERDSSKRHWYALKLREWREDKAQEAFPGSYLGFFPSLIMPDDVLESLATWAERITDENSMRHWVGNSWSDLALRCPDLLEIIRRGQAMLLDRGEMFEVWQRHNDIKRKRIPAPVLNPERVDFDKRRGEWTVKRGHGPTGVGKWRKGIKPGDSSQARANLGSPAPHATASASEGRSTERHMSAVTHGVQSTDDSMSAVTAGTQLSTVTHGAQLSAVTHGVQSTDDRMSAVTAGTQLSTVTHGVQLSAVTHGAQLSAVTHGVQLSAVTPGTQSTPGSGLSPAPIRTPSPRGRVGKKPADARQPLVEVEPNILRTLPPSRSRENRKRPSRFC